MSDPQATAIRPLTFLASYPHSGGSWLRSAIYLLVALSRSNPDKQIDLRMAAKVMPLDTDARFYEAVTGKDAMTLSEEEIAEARAKVHGFLAGQSRIFPIVMTHAIRGSFFGHPTFNTQVSRGGIYCVRSPLEVAASIIASTKASPMTVIEAMMTIDRRVRASKRTVSEPQGSWSQNVASWTAARQSAVLVVKYDDLHTLAEATLAQVAKHLKIPAKAGHIKSAIGILGEAGAALGPDAERRDYRDVLDPVHARAIIEAHGVQMDANGLLTTSALNYADIDRDAALTIAAKHAPRIDGAA